MPVPQPPATANSAGLALRPGLAAPPRAAVRAAIRRPTPGVLDSGPSCVVSVHPRVLRPHPPVSQARGDFRPCRVYAAPSLCGSASATHETFPTFPAVVSMRAVDLTPVGPRCRPVALASRRQASSNYQRVAPHESPSLPAIPDGVVDFGAASFASCCGPRVCLALRAGYDERQTPASRLLRYGCHPRFRHRSSADGAGGQGKYPPAKPGALENQPLEGAFRTKDDADQPQIVTRWGTVPNPQPFT